LSSKKGSRLSVQKNKFFSKAFIGTILFNNLETPQNYNIMRKADVVGSIAEKTGIPKVDILVALETFFKEVKSSLVEGEPVYVRGFGSFILKKRAAKIGRNIKKNVAVEIPEHFIPAFKPAKEFVQAVKDSKHELVEHPEADLVEHE
jgi:DNA-binding protein HU-beta